MYFLDILMPLKTGHLEMGQVMPFFLPLTQRPEENQPGSVPGDKDTSGMGCSLLKKTDTTAWDSVCTCHEDQGRHWFMGITER